MQKPKSKLLVAFFVYGGNGGIASMSPDLAMWWAKTYHEIKQDPRIDFAGAKLYCDTPITMTRNRAVADAQALGADMLLMLDSDNIPDGYEGFEGVKPFWSSSFKFAYDRLLKEIPTVIAAPYCGPPPPPVDPVGYVNHGEVPYLFQWTNKEGDDPNTGNKLDLITRVEGAKLAGIYPMAALPTGVCLFTLKAFEGMKTPYFYYQWNEDHSEKTSTEDVAATRDIGMYWKMTKGYDVLFANCDAWAFHLKAKKVGRPVVVSSETVAERFAEAIRENWSKKDEIRTIDFSEAAITPPKITAPSKNDMGLKRRWDILGPEDNEIYISDEEWQTFEDLAKEEASNPVLVADPPPVADDDDVPDTDIDDDGYSPVKSNGKAHALRHKMIGQRKVAVLDSELSDESVEGIQSITNWLVGKLNGGVDVAVIHPGTGQGTSAILSCLPSMSRIVAFDSVSQYGSNEYAKHFNQAFEKELESGLVKADVEGKRFPATVNYKVDMAFIENFVTAGKLETWRKAVSPKGILAGMGYQTPEVMELVESFRKKNDLPIQANGDLWVIPVGGIANAAG